MIFEAAFVPFSGGKSLCMKQFGHVLKGSKFYITSWTSFNYGNQLPNQASKTAKCCQKFYPFTFISKEEIRSNHKTNQREY